MAERRQFLISCEHGGNQVPAHLQDLFSGHEERLNSHYGYDLGALPLARMLAKGLAAPLVKSETTRLLVDLNRSVKSHNLFSELTQKLDREQRARLVEQYYLPYRTAVTARVHELITNGAQVIHLSVHSFTPIFHGRARQTDVGLLYDPRRREEKKFSENWQQTLKQSAPKLRVRCNYPYRGTADGLVKTLRLSLSSGDYLGIELEVNQALLNGRHTFPQSLQDCLLATLQEQSVSD